MDNKGFTLVEVLLALALVATTATFLLQIMSSSFKTTSFLTENKEKEAIDIGDLEMQLEESYDKDAMVISSGAIHSITLPELGTINMKGLVTADEAGNTFKIFVKVP